MRGKVIYRIACGTCTVCITYGLIMQALRGKDITQSAAAERIAAAAAVETIPVTTAVPTAEPTTVPYTGYGADNNPGYGRRGKKNRDQRYGESEGDYSGLGDQGGRGRHAETMSAETEQETGSTVQENKAADNPPSLNEYLSAFRCGGCRHNCSLLNPRCMKGRTKKQNASIQYQETYGG